MTSNVFAADTFNEFLASQFDERRARNPRYSLRAFAKSLGLSHSRLSEILSGQTISMVSAQSICEVLGLGPTETNYLLDLVRTRTGRNEKLRTEAAERIELKKTQREFQTNNSGDFLLSKPVHAALIEFLTGTSQSLPEISQRLRTSMPEIERAIDDLQAHGFIRREGDQWVKVNGYLKFESPVASERIRDFHRFALTRAAESLEQPIEQRKFLTFVMTVRPDSVAAARDELEAFAAQFSKKYADSETHDGAVYSLGLQFFGL